MAKVDPIPPDDELKKRREPKFVLDVKQITQRDEARIRAWSLELMQKNEHKLNNKWKDHAIVTSGTLKPESIDIGTIYNWPELQWYIVKERTQWALLLMSKHVMLAKLTYAKI